MSMNEKVKLYLDLATNGVTEELIPMRKKLKDLTPKDWPEDPCITCISWVATSQEINLGECRFNTPKESKKNGELGTYPLTPPHYFCQKHCHRKYKTLSYAPNKK